MTDFAKEARDLPDFAEETYAITAVFRGEHMDDAAMTVLDRRITEALRRMHAAGVAEGMARAAEIARTAGRLEKAEPDDWCSATEARCQIAVDVVADTRKQIAEAILAAAPPKES